MTWRNKNEVNRHWRGLHRKWFRLTRIDVVVVEMEGEEISHGVICATFESGGGNTGNNFVRSGGMHL